MYITIFIQLQHILDKSLITDSLLKSEVYSFRKGSLIVFFRMYAAKGKLDSLLDLHSKAVINLSKIESIYIEDSVILSRLRDIVRSAFRASKLYLNQEHGDITIDIEQIKIGNIVQMTEHYFRLDKQSHRENHVPPHTGSNVNSHKTASFVTGGSNEPSSQHGHNDLDHQKDNHSKKVHRASSPVDSGHPQWLEVSSHTPSTSTPKPATQSTVSLQILER